MLIHSERDDRCPLEQAEQMFNALRRLGKETRLVVFPEETHELSRSGTPSRRVERLGYILDWFQRHL
jgi:dipeptidyl aminopeptidase/acylaminoacyl peptidase